MDPLVQPSIESLVPTNLCSAGPVYAFAFACNAKIITTATYFPFGNLALGRTSEHVYMQRSSKVRASQCGATPSYTYTCLERQASGQSVCDADLEGEVICR